jgi:NADPH-dependent 2,4-dienoyl-CoA reductase/sulfur reductase-like enzyme
MRQPGSSARAIDMHRIVVVGGSLAGIRSIEALRREGFDGRITLVGAEPHFPPYDRPPLSKSVLLGASEEDIRLRVKPDLDIDLLLNQRAMGLELGSREVLLRNDERLPFDGLVIATGAKPRQPRSLTGDPKKVFVLRDVEDSIRLRDALNGSPRVAVVGGGFIGCEVAASCRQLGLDVTIVESAAYPMEAVLGTDMASELAVPHHEHGVTLKTNATVTAIQEEALILADGSTVPADIVIVAVGAAPEVDWLQGSGLNIENGVLLDETCAAIGASGVVAAGDVARWYNPLYEQTMRIEHWSNAVEQADAAAQTLLAGPRFSKPFESAPYFWSDQYDAKIQFVGRPLGSAQVVEGSVQERRFVAVYLVQDRIMGALCVNSASRLGKYRRMVTTRASVASLSDTVRPVLS